MKKKILPFLMPFVLVLPFGSAFAYEGGLLDGKSLGVLGSDYTYALTDNDFGTGASATNVRYAFYVFEKPVNLKSFYIKFTTPVSQQPVIVFINSAGDVIKSVNVYDSYDGKQIDALFDDVAEVRIASSNSSNMLINEFDVFGDDPYSPVLDLVDTHTYDSVSLSWTNPEGSIGTIIKQNDFQIANLDGTKNSFEISGLMPETSYKFDVISIHQNGESAAVSKVVTTGVKPKEKAGDVEGLKAEVEHDRVDLSWHLPTSDNLQHVNIYRDVVTETAWVDRVLGTIKVSAASTKIFETNGTYFNDLTVQPETTYEYTLTTTSTDGLESDGVTTEVTTLEEPIPKFEGAGFEKDSETGDYTYYWTEPTTGQVKVMLDGQLYKTVSSADKKIIIPSSDMPVDIMGAPKVKLIPVNNSGKEGEPYIPRSIGGGTGSFIDNVKVPFSITDLLKTSTGLFYLVGSIVLLALSFLLVPKLRGLIVNAFSKNKKEPGKRRTKTEREREEREKKERESKDVKERSERDVRSSVIIEKEPRKEARTARERFDKVERVANREAREPRFKASRERTARSQRISARESREPRIRERNERLSRAERMNR